MKLKGIFSTLCLYTMLMLLIVRCSDDEAVNYSLKDVSSRITGFSSSKTGPGAELTINGSQLQDVKRIFFGNQMIAAKNFIDHTESAITLGVPTSLTPNVDDEKTKLLIVFKGPERAFTEIQVVPFPAIASFMPHAAATGETVTLIGVNFDLVTGVKVSGVDATVISKTATLLKFTVPAGASTGKIVLVSDAGDSKSAQDLVTCESEPTSIACREDLINTNGSFEATDVGVVGSISGWNLSGARITSEITDETAYRGSKSAKITVNSIGSNAWDIQPTSTMTVDPAGTYRLSVWVKGSGLANVKFALDQGGTPGWSEYASPQMAINSNQWTEVTYDFSPSTETDNSVRLAISMSYTGNVGGVMYMDDLRVVRIDE